MITRMHALHGVTFCLAVRSREDRAMITRLHGGTFCLAVWERIASYIGAPSYRSKYIIRKKAVVRYMHDTTVSASEKTAVVRYMRDTTVSTSKKAVVRYIHDTTASISKKR